MKDISLHILDIAQNSISAGATIINIGVNEDVENDILVLQIDDNGKGMNPETVERVTDPYYTSRKTRKVGLGIPLLMHNARQAGGSFSVSSDPGKGTRITALFRLSHMDLPPRGDIAGVISLLSGANPGIDFIYRHSTGKAEYVFDTREVKDTLQDVPLSEPAVIRYMKEMIDENIRDIAET
jgi:anti-sigma regulatory factor (Ser/Thr protein kinase)